MTSNRHTLLAAALGFAVTSAVMLPPVFEARADAAVREELRPLEPTLEVDKTATARMGQMLRRQAD